MRSTGNTRALVIALRVGFCAMCVGLGLGTLAHGSEVSTTLFMDLGWSEQATSLVVDSGSYALLACGALLWFGRARWSLWFVIAWMTLDMVAGFAQTTRGSWIVPLARASRYIAPLALMLLSVPGSSSTRPGYARAVWVLRGAAAATFIGHGAQSLLLEPEFVDLLIAGGQTILGVDFDQPTAELMLYAIGCVDLIVGIAIVTTRPRNVALYMAIWGLVAATSRIVHSGPPDFAQFLLRLPHCSVPLAVFLAFLPRA